MFAEDSAPFHLSEGKFELSPVAQMVKNPPAKRETWVQSLGWKDRAWQPTPVFLPGEFPWTEEPGGLQSMGLQLDTTEGPSTDRQNFPGGSVVTSLSVNIGDMGSIFGPGRSCMPRVE